MELRAGYRQTAVGVIPEEWQTPKVGDVCGCIVPGRNKPTLFDGDIPWITTPDLAVGRSVSRSRLGLCVSRAEAQSVGSKIVPVGAVLMSCAGELGIVAITAKEIVVNQQLHAFIPTERIDASFLLNALDYLKEMIKNSGTKTAVPYLNKNACNSIPVPLPPLPEQRAIATALSDVDALIAGLERLIVKKRDIKQAAMQQLLTGQTRLPGFSGEWKVKKLNEVSDVIDPHPSHRAPDEVSNGVPFVGIGDLSEEGDIVGRRVRVVSPSVLGEHAARYNLKDELIGLGRVASIGKVVALKENAEGYAISPTLGVIRGKEIRRSYLLHALKSKFVTDQFTKIMSGSTRSSVGMEVLRELQIEIPPSEAEQAAIAEVLSDIVTDLEALESRVAKTRALKQGMMQELLTGRTRLV